MRISSIKNNFNFRANEASKLPQVFQNIQQNKTTVQETAVESQQPKRKELIDVLVDKVKNPRDVDDCVAVPRGIFKAYILLMSGTGLMSISSLIPKNAKAIKAPLGIIGGVLNILSAYYFAKPFAIKDLSPTVKKEELNK